MDLQGIPCTMPAGGRLLHLSPLLGLLAISSAGAEECRKFTGVCAPDCKENGICSTAQTGQDPCMISCWGTPDAGTSSKT